MSRDLTVRILGESKDFTRAVDGAITKTEGITGKLKGVGKGMVIGAGMGAFNLLTGAVDLAIGKLAEAHDAYLDDQKGQALLAQALKNNIPNWDGNTAGAEEYAGAMGRLGFADDEVRASLGTLVGITHDLTKAQGLNNVAMDLARAKGISLEQATDAVSKAAVGNGRALKSLGIDIAGATDAAGFLDAIQKNVAGSAETWAATNEGQLAVSNVKVGEAMERVGAIVDQFSQVAAPILADALTVVVGVFEEVWGAIGPVVGALVNALRPAFEKIGPVASRVFGVVKDVVKSLQPVFEIVFGAIGTIISTAVDVYSAAFTVLGDAIGWLGRVFENMGKLVSKVFSVIAPVVKAAINAVIGAVNGVIGAINRVQIHVNFDTPVGPIKFDWGGVNLGTIPYLHTGGVVPGAPGSDVLAMLQAGERVTPANARPGVTVIVNGNVYGLSGVDELMDKIAERLRLDGV